MKYISCFLSCIILFSACRTESKLTSSTARTFTDMAGRSVVVPSKLNKIFIDRISSSLVYAFDTIRNVNTAFRYNDTEKRFLKKSFYEGKPYVLETGSEEEIIRLDPDLIILSQPISPVAIEKADALQAKTKIPVVLFDTRIDKYKTVFTLLGNLLDKPDKASDLTRFVEKYIDSIPSKIRLSKTFKKTRLYYAEGLDGLQTDPSGSMHSVLIDSVAAVNVAQTQILDGKGMTAVSMEQIYKWNPEVILVWSGNFDDLNSYKAICRSELWKNVGAVMNKRVYQVPWKPFGWIDRPPGVNRLMGYIWLTHLLYPELFRSNLPGVTAEYFRLFYHYEMSNSELTRMLNPSPVF